MAMIHELAVLPEEVDLEHPINELIISYTYLRL